SVVLAREIAEFIEELVPERRPGSEEIFLWGDPASEVTGVVVTWMATVEAIDRAVEEGCNLIISHEALTYPYAFRGNLEQSLHWRSNQARLSPLAKHDITVFRAHGLLDAYAILDDFALELGLPEPAFEDNFVRLYEIPPTPVRTLAKRAAEIAGEAVIRVTGDMDRTAERVGLPWGGLALSLNAAFIESLLALEPDVLIGGESDEYAMFMMMDCDVPFIEAGHAGSENPGLRATAEDIAAEYPEIKVIFHELNRPWRPFSAG
ncbi:MAG: Nif3-like dinuclear metal center hexameric protein, partial [Armatimonadota bacterium]